MILFCSSLHFILGKCQSKESRSLSIADKVAGSLAYTLILGSVSPTLTIFCVILSAREIC